MKIPRPRELKNLLRKHQPHSRQIICLNCGSSVSGSYCSICGQAADVARYTTRGLFADLYDQFRKIDAAKTVLTFWDLLVRPGQFVREYLAGKRVDYLTPIKYFLYAFILQIAAGLLIHSITGDDVHLLTDGSDMGSQVIDLAATGFWGICWWIVYRRSGLNVTENIVAAFYFTAQTFMFTLGLRLVLGPFMNRGPYMELALSITDMVIYLGYSFHFAHRLFREKVWKIVLKQLFLVIIYLVILLAMTLTGTLTQGMLKGLIAPQP